MRGVKAPERERPGAPAWGRRQVLPAVLAVPPYRQLWFYGVIYYHAYTYEMVVAGWVALLLTNSAAAVGLVGFSRSLPMFLLGLLFGTIAERVAGSRLLLGVQVIGGLAALTLALLFTLGEPRVWQIALCTSLFGCGWACDFAVRRGLIGRLFEAGQVANAMSLETMTRLASKIVATSLGGVILAAGGPRAAYWWLAAIYLFGIVNSWRLQGERAIDAREHAVGTAPFAQLRLGWTAALAEPLVRGVLLITVIMNLLVFPYQNLIAVIARDILQVGSARMGLFAGIDGVGTLIVAGMLTFWRRPARLGLIFVIGALGQSLLIPLLVSLRGYEPALLVHVLVGACSACFGAMQSSIIVTAMAPAVRAQVLGLLAMAIGCGPFGALLAGRLSVLVGPSQALTAMALVALLLNLLIVISNRALLEQGGRRR